MAIEFLIFLSASAKRNYLTSQDICPKHHNTLHTHHSIHIHIHIMLHTTFASVRSRRTGWQDLEDTASCNTNPRIIIIICCPLVAALAAYQYTMLHGQGRGQGGVEKQYNIMGGQT